MIKNVFLHIINIMRPYLILGQVSTIIGYKMSFFNKKRLAIDKP